MLTPRLNNCEECAAIPALLSDINCKVSDVSKKLYNNIAFLKNSYIPAEVMFDLLQYKRILTYKNINSDWADCYSVEDIASKVKLLIHK